MVEIDASLTIDKATIHALDADELETTIHQSIVGALAAEMSKHIDEMSFIDMRINPETEEFEITAELVLCAKAQIITTAEMQAQKLAAYGLTEAQILDVLETQLQDTKGF